MDLTITSRLKNAWNAFRNKEPTVSGNYGTGYSLNPTRPRFTRGNERSFVTAVYNRIAVDAAATSIRHCQLDDNDRYLNDMDSDFNLCLTLEANLDQTSRSFFQDIVMSLLDEGAVAVVPTYTSSNPNNTDSYKIYEMRTAKILEWRPKHIKVRLYNDINGQREDIWVNKRNAAIIENPFYSVCNEPNSVVQRLIRKLGLLDVTDEMTASGKLDLIIQLPYVIKTDARRKQAEERRKNIEDQLASSRYGVAYTDGTERITQLNRSLENNLLKQIESLQDLFYSQVGMTAEILNGTADEKTMLNYYNHTIEPIVSGIIDEFKRKFLSKNARTRKQSVLAFRDPFKLVPVNDIAEIADKFTRNEVMTSNEIRQIVGMKPSDDPKADQLVNSNISQPTDESQMQYDPTMMEEQAGYGEEGGYE